MFELRCSVSELCCSDVDVPAAQAAAELAKHVSQIMMHPADQNGDRNYVCQGDWNLLGNLTYHRGVRMVAGVDLSHRPLGYEKRSQPLSAVESIAQRPVVSCQSGFCQPKCSRFQGVPRAKLCQLIRNHWWSIRARLEQ
jgi:hypothetical protein